MVHLPLLNADIASIICESLDKKSLSVLARTARFLQDPSLRELWRDVEQLSQLLSPFKPSLKQAKGKIYFSDAPTSKQWERFRFYAQFVRNFQISYDDIELPSLLMLLRHRPLLPRLKSLVVRSWPDQGYCSLSMFFVPSMRTFEIYSCEEFSVLDQLITVLGTTTPALQNLKIDDAIYSNGLQEFGPSISIFHNLCSINIPLTGSQAHSILPHLSTLPALSRIRFYFTDSTSIPDGCAKYAFSAARDLQIESESCHQLTDFMALTRFNTLFNLQLHGDRCEKDKHSLFKAVSISCGQFLNQIKIVGGMGDPDAVNFSTLSPLSKYTNLRSLYLAALRGLWPADEDIQNIAESWPNLEEFHVIPQSWDNIPSPLTWTGLLLLINTCINLTKISISVNASAKYIPNITSSIHRPVLAIKIYPRCSPVDCPKPLADNLILALADADLSVALLSNVDIKMFGDCQNCRVWEEALNLREYFIKGWKEREKYAHTQCDHHKCLGLRSAPN